MLGGDVKYMVELLAWLCGRYDSIQGEIQGESEEAERARSKFL